MEIVDGDLPTTGPPVNRIYDWDAWLDGQWRRATHGTDFQVTPQTFRTQLYNAATRRKLKVRTRVVDESVYFQSYIDG